MELFLAFCAIVALGFSYTSLMLAQRLQARCAELATLYEGARERTPAVLRQEVNELRAALAATDASCTRQFGKLWKRIGLDGLQPQEAGPTVIETEGTSDGRFEALIDLQNRPSAG